MSRVWVEDRTMKSILFTVLREKLESREKKQTYRCTFIPKYEVGEIVMLRFKKDDVKEDLYPVKIMKMYPRQLKDFTLEEARLDGFESIEEFQKEIIKLNKVKLNQWGFIIRFKEYLGVIE